VIQVETKEKEEKFYHKKRHRAKVVRKVPKKVTYLIPRVDIYLERDETVYDRGLYSWCFLRCSHSSQIESCYPRWVHDERAQVVLGYLGCYTGPTISS
jgi:hypothetical protein